MYGSISCLYNLLVRFSWFTCPKFSDGFKRDTLRFLWELQKIQLVFGNHVAYYFFWSSYNSMFKHAAYTTRYICLFSFSQNNRKKNYYLVYAFYERSKPLLWLLSIIFVLIESSVVVIMTLGVPKYQVVQLEVFPPPFGHCLVTKVPGILSFVL